MGQVGVGSDGSEVNNGSGNYDGPAISADGRYVAFESAANNLVAGDKNDRRDVFVHDRATAVTTRVSVGNRPSGRPVISADGRQVAFEADASNLVPRDTNRKTDVFVWDRRARVTSRVSVASSGAQANDRSDAPSINRDGRDVAFYSDATVLIPGDEAGSDVFSATDWRCRGFASRPTSRAGPWHRRERS
jgi:WD40-like Beta Propeller Repeat